jgi:hypothetical protein
MKVTSTKALIAAVALSVAATTGVANAAPMTGGAKSISTAAAATTGDATLTDVRWNGRRGYYRGRGWGPGVGIGLGLGALAAGAAIASAPYYGRGYCDPYYEYCGPRRRVYYNSYYAPGPYYYAPRRYYGYPY